MEESGSVLVVLGVEEEQWTTIVLKYLHGSHVSSPLFFAWDTLREARVQLELVRYPVTQLWSQGRLVQEVVGYHPDSLKKLVDTYFKINRNSNGKNTKEVFR